MDTYVDNRIETLPDATALLFIRSLQFVFVVSFGVLILETVWVQGSGPGDGNDLLYLNLIVGGISCVVVAVTAVVAYKDIASLRKKKVVVPKRVRTFFSLALVDFLFRLVMLCLFLALDIFLMIDKCAWIYSSTEVLAFIKWSLFNATVSNQFLHILALMPKETIESVLKRLRIYSYLVERKNVQISQGCELPGSAYAIVFFSFFTATEVCILFSLLASVGVIGGKWCSSSNLDDCMLDLNLETCSPWDPGCSTTTGYGKQTLSIVGSVITVFNMFVYITGIYWTNRILLPLPYKEYKYLHVQLGYQILTRMAFTVLAILNYIVFVLVGFSSCPVSFATTAGFAPLSFALTMCTSMNVWMQTPRVAESGTWPTTDIDWEPFGKNSAENMCSYVHILKGFIFSFMVYDIDELPEDEREFCVEEFLQEYDMPNHEVIWNKKIDSKCLLAWNAEVGQIIMAFRGTASGRNVLSDLKIWRENHPPVRGNYFLGTRPLVHAGFREFFYDSGTKSRCFETIERLLSSASGIQQWEIFICGHSLGGAAATLAAYETSTWLDVHHSDITYTLKCYCFGSPRVGNSAFVKSYNRQCPDTWNIMHLDDVVTRGGKFMTMYTREGRSLFLTNSGTILEPSYIERVTLRGIKTSISQHLMPSYGSSIVSMVTFKEWDSPGLQRIHFAITNTKAYRSMSNKFTSKITLSSAVGDLEYNVDLATGVSSNLVHRAHGPMEQRRPPGSAYIWFKSILHRLFS